MDMFRRFNESGFCKTSANLPIQNVDAQTLSGAIRAAPEASLLCFKAEF